MDDEDAGYFDEEEVLLPIFQFSIYPTSTLGLWLRLQRWG